MISMTLHQIIIDYKDFIVQDVIFENRNVLYKRARYQRYRIRH